MSVASRPSTFTLSEEASRRAAARWAIVRHAFLSQTDAKAVSAFMELGQKRRAALDAIAQGKVELVSGTKAALHKQGDLAFYTMHWKLIAQAKDDVGDGSAGSGEERLTITKDQYVRYFWCCGRVLMPSEPPSPQDIEAEWATDAQGADRMDFACFCNALYELVDQWTTSLQVDEYVELLGHLHTGVAQLLLTTTPAAVAEAIATVCHEKPPAHKPSAAAAAAAVEPVGPSAHTIKGLPPHTCATRRRPRHDGKHDGSGEGCAACRRIREWEAARRRLLELMEGTGKVRWLGAWHVRPHAYTQTPSEANLASLIPLQPPLAANMSPVWKSPAGVGSLRAQLPPGFYEYISAQFPEFARAVDAAAADSGQEDNNKSYAPMWRPGTVAHWDALTRMPGMPTKFSSDDGGPFVSTSSTPIFDPADPSAITHASHHHQHLPAVRPTSAHHAKLQTPDAVVDLNRQLVQSIKLQKHAEKKGQKVSLRSIAVEATSPANRTKRPSSSAGHSASYSSSIYSPTHPARTGTSTADVLVVHGSDAMLAAPELDNVTELVQRLKQQQQRLQQEQDVKAPPSLASISHPHVSVSTSGSCAGVGSVVASDSPSHGFGVEGGHFLASQSSNMADTLSDRVHRAARRSSHVSSRAAHVSSLMPFSDSLVHAHTDARPHTASEAVSSESAHPSYVSLFPAPVKTNKSRPQSSTGIRSAAVATSVRPSQLVISEQMMELPLAPARHAHISTTSSNSSSSMSIFSPSHSRPRSSSMRYVAKPASPSHVSSVHFSANNNTASITAWSSHPSPTLQQQQQPPASPHAAPSPLLSPPGRMRPLSGRLSHPIGAAGSLGLASVRDRSHSDTNGESHTVFDERRMLSIQSCGVTSSPTSHVPGSASLASAASPSRSAHHHHTKLLLPTATAHAYGSIGGSISSSSGKLVKGSSFRQASSVLSPTTSSSPHHHHHHKSEKGPASTDTNGIVPFVKPVSHRK